MPDIQSISQVSARLRRAAEQLVESGGDADLAARVTAGVEDLIDQHETLYRHGPAIIHSIDPTGHMISVSDWWLERLGYERSEILGKKSVEFLTAESARYAAEVVLPRFMKEGFCRDVPYQMVCKDGSVIDVLLSAIAEYSPTGEFLRSFAVLQDVTELRQQQSALEEEVARRTAAEAAVATQLQKLQATNQALEQFNRASAHDLQSPLRNIQTLAMMLEEDFGADLPEEARDFLHQIEQRVDKLQLLIGGILEFSRLSLTEIDMVEAPLDPTLDKALDSLSAEIASAGATIEREPLPNARISPAHITQLFERLIGNALRYRKTAPEIHISGRQTPHGIEIVVSDNGIGIESTYAGKIFEPLKRLHTYAEFPGSGMGLAICRRIADLHGGAISLDDGFEGGARFVVVLPAPDPVEAAA